jgi:hypothetical protein
VCTYDERAACSRHDASRAYLQLEDVARTKVEARDRWQDLGIVGWYRLTGIYVYDAQNAGDDGILGYIGAFSSGLASEYAAPT